MKMEPISNKLKQANTSSFQQRFEAIRNSILGHPKIAKFIEENQEKLDPDTINRSLSKFEEYISQTTECCGDKTECCKNILKGFIPQMYIANGIVDIRYLKCKQKILEEKEEEMASMVTTMYLPKDVLEADLENIDINNSSRLKIVEFITEYLEIYKRENVLPKKGLYIFGEFGVGKTFVLATVANELAKLSIPSLVVYTPELFRELRSSMGEADFEEKLNYIKNIPVLMLDDLGAESLSIWVRDDVIGTILQYRMTRNLPIFVSSNFTYEQLQNQLSVTDQGHKDEFKAGRILERIKTLTTELELTGENRRNS